MKNLFILISLLFACSTAVAQDSFSTVEERMTGKEFMASGLNKLTDEELAALNTWLRDHSVATLENRVAGRSPMTVGTDTGSGVAGASTDKRGFEGADTSRDDIVSRLIGEFEGWDGETVFKLENGMVWKQEESDKFRTRKMTNPMVTIKSGMFSSWRLSIGDYNKSIEVIRIQ